MKPLFADGSPADGERPTEGASARGRKRSQAATRALFTAAGCLWVGLAVVGAAVPLMPSTVFLIAAAWCFARGNARLYRRLRRHPLYAPVRDWQAGRGLSTTTKIVAVGSIILSFSLSIAAVAQPFIKVLLAGFALGLSVYLLRQPRRTLRSSEPYEGRDLAVRREHV